MGIAVYPITESFAAEVGDVNLAEPLDPADFETIQQAFWTYSVLIFPGQELSEAQQIAFAERFGPLEPGSAYERSDTPKRISKGLADIANLEADGGIWAENSRKRLFALANRLWHTDSSFKRLPGLASLLYASSIAPIGGHTEFADLRAAYDALPAPTQKRLKGLVAEHSIMNSRAELGFGDFNAEDFATMPPVPQVLTRTIPQSGRRTLYLASHAGRIYGMPKEEGRAMIKQLIEHATQRQFVYTHRWRQHDLVMWDNRCTMHRGKEFDDQRWRRDMKRATVIDVANTCEQEGVPAPAA